MSAFPLIAVVDDDPSILRALRRLLSLSGFAVTTFASGEELLAWEQLPTVACLVLDVNLTGLNGFEVQECLVDSGLAIPIVFITAHDDAATRERAERAADAHYLRKPFDEQALVEEIQKALATA
jgi:FixJ family two-component response regulator